MNFMRKTFEFITLEKHWSKILNPNNKISDETKKFHGCYIVVFRVKILFQRISLDYRLFSSRYSIEKEKNVSDGRKVGEQINS